MTQRRASYTQEGLRLRGQQQQAWEAQVGRIGRQIFRGETWQDQCLDPSRRRRFPRAAATQRRAATIDEIIFLAGLDLGVVALEWG